MASIEEIQNKHQYIVWDKVSQGNAKGLLQKLKIRLLNEHNLSETEGISLTAYALERSNILVLAGDKDRK